MYIGVHEVYRTLMRFMPKFYSFLEQLPYVSKRLFEFGLVRTRVLWVRRVKNFTHTHLKKSFSSAMSDLKILFSTSYFISQRGRERFTANR